MKKVMNNEVESCFRGNFKGILKLKTIILLILCLGVTTIFSEETTKKQRIPLYEQTDGFWKYYRYNQPVKETIRWTQVIGFSGVGLGVYLDAKFFPRDIPAGTLLLGGSAMIIGPIYGFISGVIKGDLYSKKKLTNPNFHLKKYRFGNEIVGGSDFSVNRCALGKYLLTYQMLNNNKKFPSEYRLGIGNNEFSILNKREISLAEDTDLSAIQETIIYFDALFDTNREKFDFYYGLGAGYSTGKLEYKDSSINSEFESILIRPIVGLTYNALDFFYLRFELDSDIAKDLSGDSKTLGMYLHDRVKYNISFGTDLF